MAGTAGTSSSAHTMEVYLVGLRCGIVEDSVDVFDVETTGGKISSKEEIDGAGTEGFDGVYSLLSIDD